MLSQERQLFPQQQNNSEWGQHGDRVSVRLYAPFAERITHNHHKRSI